MLYEARTTAAVGSKRNMRAIAKGFEMYKREHGVYPTVEEGTIFSSYILALNYLILPLIVAKNSLNYLCIWAV